MRRWVYVLVIMFVLQLSGLRTFCVSSRETRHPCCPVKTQHSLPNRTSLPDCCLISVLNYQGSITEVRSSDLHSELTFELATVSSPSILPVEARRASLWRLALPTVSPPLSPLSQTCLLLI